jgi:hypothetical protein
MNKYQRSSSKDYQSKKVIKSYLNSQNQYKYEFLTCLSDVATAFYHDEVPDPFKIPLVLHLI